MRRHVLVVLAATALVASCEQNPAAPTAASSTPTGSSPASSLPTSNVGPTTTTAAIVGGLERPITIQDACDPTTFNAVIGPGTCLRPGGTTFDQFIAQLERNQRAGAWDFMPGTTTAKLGQTFVAINRGGEVHTFTEVQAFGGGIVPVLNQLSGNPNVAPECKTLEPDDFVAPGGTYRETLHASGTVKFMCCIHPWMRLEARVTDK
jgi:plastocyanin